MMQNSCIFILDFLLVRTPIYGTNNLLGMIAGIARCAEHTNLASVPAGVGTKQSTPMSLLSPSPAPGFGIRDCALYLLLGMPWPGGHFLSPDLVVL